MYYTVREIGKEKYIQIMCASVFLKGWYHDAFQLINFKVYVEKSNDMYHTNAGGNTACTYVNIFIIT